MELLIFLLLSPAIFAQTLPSSEKPNDEPFLPIFPQYPYSPKLIKRGIDRDGVTQLTPELYAPKADARDAYTASYSNNFQRDSYFPSYNLYSKPSVSAYSPYSTAPYTPTSNLYNLLSSYPNPYATPTPYSAGSYPNYFYPPPPYPGYYNQPYPPFLPPPPGPYSRPPKSDYDSEESDDKEDNKRTETKKSKYKDSDRDSNDNQFVDGNYVSDNSRDLDGQSSSYKSPSSYNKLDDTDQRKTLYRIINISAQQNPDYLLSSNQAKAQLEALMQQALAKILAQNLIQQAPKVQYPILDASKNQNYVAVPAQAVSKTGLTYIINPGVYNKANQAQSSNSQTQTAYPKNLKYSGLQYGQKPVTRVTLERSPGLYLAPVKSDKTPSSTQSPDYGDYDLPQSNAEARNLNQEQPQDSVSYPTQNVVTAKEPQAFSYHYSGYHPEQSADQIETEKDSTEDFEKKEKSSR